MFSKKGDLAVEELLKWIIVLVFILILAGVSKPLYSFITQKSSVEVCRESALLQSTTKTLGKTHLELACPRTYLDITDTKIISDFKDSVPVRIQGYKDEQLVSTYDDLTSSQQESLVNTVFAEEMRECWYKMGEGNLAVFPQPLGTEGTVLCLVCSQIQFHSLDTKQTALFPYLKQEKIQKEHAKDRTYYEYLNVDYYSKYGTEKPFFQKDDGSKEDPTALYTLLTQVPFVRFVAPDLYEEPVRNSVFIMPDGMIRTNQEYLIVFVGVLPSYFNEKTTQATTIGDRSLYYVLTGPTDLVTEQYCGGYVN